MATAKKLEKVSKVDAGELVSTLRTTFGTHKTKSLGWRRAQLLRLLALVKENQDALLGALKEDLGRPAFEGWVAEIAYLEREVEHTLKSLKDWAKKRPTRTPMVVQPGKSYVKPDPLGVVLIISPWNYPIQLCLAPAIAAIAAGNCVVMKPSEISPACSKILAELVPKYLDGDAIRLVEGGVAETSALLEQKWDHILFTGGERVGKIVMTAAAKHLTPVTLELGGKSPVIVDRTADMDVAAKRILWGKSFNAGQTCIAPDYILVESSVKERLKGALSRTLKEFFGDSPKASSDYGRIISDHHFKRLDKMLKGTNIFHGGERDKKELFFELTLIEDPEIDSPIMTEEIFGPILPIVEIESIDEAIQFINERPKPLALYMFSASKEAQQRVLDRTSSGGAVINESGMHFAVPGLPFGGVGTSGMGAYHGHYGFETFSHMKAVLEKSTIVDPALRYPPYTESKKKWAERLM